MLGLVVNGLSTYAFLVLARRAVGDEAYGGLAVTWALFAVLAPGTFTDWSNQKLMLLQTAVVGTAAVGATWIIVSGGIAFKRQ